MFRRLRDAVARPRPLPDAPVRTPDPYVWRLPTPHDARWRRWHKRCRAAGRYLPFPQGEAQATAPVPHASWSTDDDVVRPYVLRP
ncbi:hypothetical protein AB0G32_01205 [Streptomyces sp. NPDC023723]|uniref:hypothetical protein n=1 Tax=Streptomyces sp. NPDC023723 TaxID=3154323 RepID=UPI0033E9EAED